MFGINIGYAISYKEAEGFCIETGMKNVLLPKEDFDFRVLIGFDEDGIPDDKIAKCKELQNKGVVALAETIDELFNLIQNLYASRQGIEIYHEDKPYLFMGTESYAVTEFQCEVWRSANGQRTVGEILEMVKYQDISSSKMSYDFMESVVSLTASDMLNLRY